MTIPILGVAYMGILICWFVYRYFTRFPDTVDELIVKPLVWIGPVILVHLWKKISLKELGFKRIAIKFALLSIMCGLGLTALQFVPVYLQTHKLPRLPTNFTMLAIATIGTAISEEILFRGFLFKELRKYYSSFISNGITSALFAFIHIPIILFIQHTSGLNLFLGLYVTFASSIVFGLLYEYTKNLWSPVIAHYVLDVVLLFVS